jgi:hypothetical protein
VEAGSNNSTVTLRVVGGDEEGSLKTETVKYGRETQRTRIQEILRWRGPAAYTKDRTAPEKQDRDCRRVINIWSWSPDGARHHDLLIDLSVSRNVTLTLFSDLWDIRQPVGTLAEDSVRIRYQETTSEDMEDFCVCFS